MNGNVKLLMFWDIRGDRDQDYFEFVVRELVPAATRLGLRPIGAWYSRYSRDDSAPRMMSELFAEDLDTMKTALNSDEWQALQRQLMEYVENYSHKVVNITGDFQL